MSQQPPEFGRLSPDDQRVLDLLLENGIDQSSLHDLPESDRDRGRQLLRLVGLLDDYPADDADEMLVDATMARIRRASESRHAAQVDAEIREAAGLSRFRFRLPDLMSLAAVLLIAASIGIPVMQHVRQQSVAAACSMNMVELGGAFARYAGANNGQVPVQIAGFAGITPVGWLDPLPLVREGYCEHGHASCPGHSLNLGYSYQVQGMERASRVLWQRDPGTAVLGDRNPVLDARRAANLLSPLTNSGNHAERGQNVLLHDLSVVWLEVPVRGSDDNIWLPVGGNESDPMTTPASPMDTFLAH